MLSTQNLTRRFGGLTAVDAVDFEIKQGEIHALIGPNGAGKTTFVSLLSGRLAPSSGHVVFSGNDITAMPAFERVKQGIAYTFQITSIYSKLSVYDNVALAAQTAQRRKAGLFSRIDTNLLSTDVHAVLEQVGLAQYANETAGALAYGHQRLLEVAMGLALQPKLLILDEPTQGLSDPEIANFCGLVKVVSGQITTLLIEHNMDVVMQLADRITVLNHGQVLATGTPNDIRDNSAVQTAYLGGH
nr:ABC transporter ATP-binding protein [Agrobacterium sp. AGB01]